MSPEWLPVMVLLLGGVFAAVVALNLLFTRRPGAALRAGAACLACLVLAFVLVRGHVFHSPYLTDSRHEASSRPRPKPFVLRPATTDTTGAAPSMSLVLGGVLLRVAPSNRYVLSVDGEQFLVLDSLKTGLIVDCLVGTEEKASTSISRSLFPSYPAGAHPGRTNSSTLRVRQEGKDMFRVHYATPRKIEVTGHFFGERDSGSALISFGKGIRWKGGGIPPGTTLDLTRLGKGRIDFQRSGLIQILPH